MAEDGKKRHSVEIGGEKYTLRADESEEYVRKLVEYTNEKLLAVKNANPYLGNKQAALLGALNIADEFFKWKEHYQNMLEIINESKK